MEKNQEAQAEAGERETETISLIVPFPESFIYSNATAFSMTLMDIRFGFGEVMPDRPVQSRVGVTLPIEHAAHVAMSLVAQLEHYEQSFGVIRNPNWQAMRQRALKQKAELSQSPTEDKKSNQPEAPKP